MAKAVSSRKNNGASLGFEATLWAAAGYKQGVPGRVPVSRWFIAKNQKNGRGMAGRMLRKRSGQTLFIDALKLGYMETRVNRNLSYSDIARIASTYHAWRGDGAGEYADVAGFCKSATTEEIKGHGYVLTPGRYVGAEAVEDDGEPFDQKMQRLVAQLREQQAEAAKLDEAIWKNLKGLGYDP
jgi:type I restriction enzyme M protein